MEPVSLWAAVEFTACNGSTEALLTAAARAGLHPYGVTALPGGFGGRCAAWQYPRLAALARKHRVRLRIRRKLGLYFCLRPLLRRAGLWAGLAVFVPLLLFAQQFVWYADTSSLTTGQAARACAVLREAGLQPGAAVTEAKLTAGEYALLHSGEFSWASLNLPKGGWWWKPPRPGPSRTLPPERCTASGQNAAALWFARTLPAAPCWCSRASRWKPGRASLAQPAPSGTAP